MTIEITHPEVETLINERLHSGGFRDAEEVILAALRSSAVAGVTLKPRSALRAQTGQELIDVCAKVRGTLTDEEVDTLFSRNSSVGRPVDFE